MREMGKRGGTERAKKLGKRRRREIARMGAIAMHTAKGHKLK